MRLFQRSNGYWYYETERDKPKSLKTKNKKKAKGLYKIIEQEYFNGRVAELDGDKRTTLKEFKEIFQREHTDIDQDTVDAYDLAFRLLADSIGEKTMIGRIADSRKIGKRVNPHLEKFKRDCLRRKCRKTTINTYLRHIRGILNKAYDWGYTDHKVKIAFYKIPKRHPRILRNEETKAILKYARKHDIEMYRIILFILWTGARREEVQSFVWQNVRGKSARLIGKGDKERTVPLLQKALAAMGPKKDFGPVFIQWHLDTYTHHFKVIARKCGIEDIHLHHLRHTAATQMLAKGIGKEYVQEALGHDDISTTKIYVKILQERLAEEMEKLNYDD